MSAKPTSVIAGIGSYVPEGIVTNKHIDDKLTHFRLLRVGNMLEKITGVKERRHAAEGVQASDLAVAAAREALADSGHSVQDVDTLLYAACSRDLGEPATASIVQAKLGALNATRVMDVANACNSFCSALEMMEAMVASGKTQVGLVVSGERLSTFVDWGLKNPADLKLGFAALTLGDGGGAFVLTPNTKNEDRGIFATQFYADGREWPLSVVMGGGTISPRTPEDSYFKCDSLGLNKLALKHVPEVIEKVMTRAGWKLKDLDLIVPHQVSMSIIKKIAKRIKYPLEKISVTLEGLGNIGAASIPIALNAARKEGRVGRGSRVLLVAGAAGFSAGAILIAL